MSLIVWLPLNGNLNNQGLSNITTTVSGTTSYTSGKIGQGLNCNGSTYWVITPVTLTNNCSFCFWTKTSDTNAMFFVIASTTYAYLNFWLYNGKYYLNVGDSLNNPFQNNGTDITSYSDNIWHHYVVTFNGTQCSLYIDGEYKGKAKTYKNPTTTSSKSIKIAGGFTNGHYYDLNGVLNDFRVYNHTLSLKEIKEISKGLVLHYKLDANGDGNIGNTNLVKNGWGGIENWSNGNYSTTELPSVTGITHSYYNCSTKEFIPIISNHTYELSCYIKSKTGTGTCYFSIIPYDIDKNQITYEKIAYGFRASSLTTLSEDLKSGDTIVHLTNASGWANPSTYQYVIAIFGYTDNTGYTYPDLVYTRRIYAYGTTSDKSHLDIANNTVTLNSAYSGKTIPKGTSVCLTGYGAGYYYPIAIGATNASDWVFKTINIIPKNVGFLKVAKYIRVYSMSGYQYLAGITLKDTTASNLIYDCSGYNHHGTITGSLTIDNNSPRYNYCGEFNGSSFIKSNDLNLNETSNFTISSWINITASQSYQPIFWLGNGITAQGICIHGSRSHRLEGGNGTNNFDNTLSTINLNSWTHIVITYDGTTIKRYINGVLNGTISFSYLFGNTFVRMYIGYFWAGKFKGNISDFRLYLTTLSAEDILELYNTPTFIDNQGNLLSGEFDDLSNNMLSLENYGIAKKQWLGGLSKFVQSNCQCTLTDDGYRIYRPANLTPSNNGNTMYGGFVLDNTNNRFGLIDGHTYIIEFDIKGQTSTTPDWVKWNFNFGSSPENTGLMPTPTDIVINNPVIANFNSQEWHHFSYKWTLSDGVYKTVIAPPSYGSWVVGQTYISYKHFVFAYSYNNTGTLGTDLYIRNIRMYDITTNKEIVIKKNGITEAINFVEEGNETQFFKTNTINSTKFLEI